MRLAVLKKETEITDFWNDQNKAQSTLQEIKKLEKWVEEFNSEMNNNSEFD